jgi:transposase-like protein
VDTETGRDGIGLYSGPALKVDTVRARNRRASRRRQGADIVKSKSSNTPMTEPVDAPEHGEPVRGRPGRRSLADRREAVLDILKGKASVEQVARRLGVTTDTVEKWQETAVAGVEAALTLDGPSPRERALDRRVKELEEQLADVSVKYALAQRGVEQWKAASRPTPRRRSQP